MSRVNEPSIASESKKGSGNVHLSPFASTAEILLRLGSAGRHLVRISDAAFCVPILCFLRIPFFEERENVGVVKRIAPRANDSEKVTISFEKL